MPAPLSRSLARRLAPLMALCLVPAACGGTGPPPPVSAQELAAAETFPYYKVYWVGRSFKRVPLTAVDGLASYDPSSGESAYYGNCEGHGSLLGEGTCKLPLTLTSVIYAPRSNASLGAQRNLVIRGVPAVAYEGGNALELYSGHLVIKIVAQDPADALLAASLVHPVNAPGGAGEPLPAPTYCPSLYGAVPAAVAAVMSHLPDHACQTSLATEEGAAP